MYDVYMTGLARHSEKSCPHLSHILFWYHQPCLNLCSAASNCMLRQSLFEGCEILRVCLWLCGREMVSSVSFLAKVWYTTMMTNPGLIGSILLCSSSLDSGFHARNQVAVLFLLTFWSSALTFFSGQNKCFAGKQRFHTSCTSLRK